MKRLRCIFGNHDYVTVAQKTESDIMNELKEPELRTIKKWPQHTYYRRVCLDCEDIYDSLTPAEVRLKKEKIRNLRRVRKAKQILHEMRYRKRNRVTVTARYNTVPTACFVCGGSLYEDNLGIYNCNDCGKQHESF